MTSSLLDKAHQKFFWWHPPWNPLEEFDFYVEELELHVSWIIFYLMELWFHICNLIPWLELKCEGAHCTVSEKSSWYILLILLLSEPFGHLGKFNQIPLDSQYDGFP